MLTPLFLLKQKRLLNKPILLIIFLHIIGQQLDRIEENIEKPTSSFKSKKPLIDLPGQRQNLSLKTTQTKTIEKVEQFFFFFFPKIQILTLHPLLLVLKNLKFLINLFLSYLKLKDLSGNSIPCLLQKIGIQTYLS